MSDEPEPPETIEQRMERLEKLVEVFRQELINQNKKIERLTTLLGGVHRIVEP